MAPWVNKPIEEYEQHSWGKTIVVEVQKPTPGNDGFAHLKQVQYDTATGERIDDIDVFWNLRDIKQNKKMYEKELAIIQEQITYIQTAIQNAPEPQAPQVVNAPSDPDPLVE